MQATQKETIKNFFSTTAGEYKKKYLKEALDFQVFSFLARRKSIISMLAEESHKTGSRFKRCLDIGCGTGDYLKELLDFTEEVTGADYAEGMLLEARDRIKGHERSIKLSQEDIEGMSFPDNYFDFVICAGVLEYLYDDTKAFQEMQRVLKPGGSAYITFPNNFSLFMQLDRLYSVLTHLGGDILERLGIFERILGRKRANTEGTMHRVYSPLKVRDKVRRLGFKYRRHIFSGYGSFYLCNKIPYYHLLARKLENINKLPLVRQSALNYIIQIEK